MRDGVAQWARQRARGPEMYAVRDAGVEVELRREPGLIHAFIMLDEVSPACAAAADRVAAGLRTHLHRR